jgi:hypothetical protein|uniref:Uncharacterized protein n=1 Tax=Desulfobacca acetoxidans TaxID=60893 RepID=A0A7C5AN16_9BACT
MTSVDPKLLAAISGAVTFYLQDEEALLAAQAQTLALTPPAPPVSLWGVSGRQWIMQMRVLTQRRSLR